MSDKLNYNRKTGKFAFYSRKEVPWHGLGQFINEASTSQEALTQAQLDYIIKTGPVFASFIPERCKAKTTPEGIIQIYDHNDQYVCDIPKRGVIVPGIRSIFRDDTKDLFGIVTDRYEVVQNAESLDLIYEIVKGPTAIDKSKIVIETAGALNKGETIFVTARMTSYTIDLGTSKDLVDKYIVFTTSHNSSAKLTAIITDVRVVCANTLAMALATPRKIALKHTKNIRDKFSEFAYLLGTSNRYSDEVKLILEGIAQLTADKETIKEYVYDLVLTSNRELVRGKDINKVSDEVISKRVKNKVAEMLDYIDQGPGQNVARGTLYWLYNGVTSYYQNGVDYKDADNRFKELTGGTAENNIIKAYDKLIPYVRV